MLLSYRWLCELLGDDPGIDRVTDRLTIGGLEVEHVDAVGTHLRDVFVARVLSIRAHPTSKNPLSLVTVTLGDGASVEVVCGAANVPPPGHGVAFARVGARVSGKGGVPVTLEARTVAGITSLGMLCAEDELSLGTDHQGILVFTPDTPVGTSLSALGLEDHVLSVNVTPNRGDALSHRGVARDISALLDLPLPPLRVPALPDGISPGPSLDVSILDPDRCLRYAAAVIDGVSVRPSPLATRVRLHRLGVRPINAVVDVTNLVMLAYGQPLHAFDADLLRGGRLVVRRAQTDEPIVTLDGVTRNLTADDLVIADSEGSVAIAGVMGGDRSGIQPGTRSVVIECAAFEPRGVRRTARRLGLHSESSHRFERGTDTGAVGDLLRIALGTMVSHAGGRPVGDPVDVYPTPAPRRTVTLRAVRVAATLGVDIPQDHAIRSLRALGCDAAPGVSGLAVTVPTHRNDLTREIDLIEEVGRVWGFDRIPGALPPTRSARAGARRDWHARRQIRATLCALGLDEAVSYVFVSSREIAALGLDPAEALRLANPLSEDRALLRPSLLPRLVGALGRARRHGETRVRLFEIGSVFGRARSGEALPQENTKVAMVMAGPRDGWLSRTDDVDFYDIKGVVEELVLHATGDEAVLDRDSPPPAWAHPGAYAWVRAGDRSVGVMAVLHPDVVAAAELGRTAVVAELDAACLGETVRTRVAKAPGKFPSMRRDVALLVAVGVPAGAITKRIEALAGPLCESVTLFDRYTGKELPEGTHSLAFALTFRADDRTLLDAEIDAIADAVVQGACETFGAARR